ncbi:MAG: metal ABC transporter permease [Alcanivoracaceae bacterium]|jgi:zinc/manganese transport system permease protein|nr:metal ABC transporter permease [Alcanivoracaceae bacterium]
MSTTESLYILWPAFVAGTLILLTHVPLGRQVLNRGIIFIDLAVAQAAATGALASQILLNDATVIWQQTGALIAALIMVVSLHGLSKRHAHIQEALIGGSYILLASFAMLLASHDPHAAEYLHQALSGQILWVTSEQLLWLSAASAVVLVMMGYGKQELLRFYLPLAIAVTAAVQIVGVYLVFACLIFPALASRRLNQSSGIVRGMLAGMIGLVAGLIVSLLADIPSAPTIVITLAISAAVLARSNQR